MYGLRYMKPQPSVVVQPAVLLYIGMGGRHAGVIHMYSMLVEHLSIQLICNNSNLWISCK